MKWELEGRATTTVTSAVSESGRPSHPTATDPESGPSVTTWWLEPATGSGAIIDVRSPAEFSGETMAPPHLPG